PSINQPTQTMLPPAHRLTDVLNHPQYPPLPMKKQVLVIFAATNGYLDKYPVSAARRYEEELYRFMDTRHPEILKQMAEKKDIKGELTGKIKAALEELAGVFQAEPLAQAS